jgi:hypothetical protein
VRVLDLMPLALTLLAAVGNGLAWYRLSRRGHRWPARRAACMLAGSLCVGIALLPPVVTRWRTPPRECQCGSAWGTGDRTLNTRKCTRAVGSECVRPE